MSENATLKQRNLKREIALSDADEGSENRKEFKESRS